MKNNSDAAQERMRRRICRFLLGGGAGLAEAATRGKILLDGGDRGTVAIEAAALSDLVRRGHVLRTGEGVVLADVGKAWLKRDRSDEDAHRAQHRDIEAVTLREGNETRTVAVNFNESPLAQLSRRKDRNGQPFLTSAELLAGERLRRDYTQGHLVPRTGANWQAAVSSGKRAGHGGLADLTDVALAARQRVDQAVSAVGPELSGVLIDVCCFLKGLEVVEAERGWPARSAKLLLKSALAMLARHYAPDAATKGRNARSRHWGADDYRPSLFK